MDKIVGLVNRVTFALFATALLLSLPAFAQAQESGGEQPAIRQAPRQTRQPTARRAVAARPRQTAEKPYSLTAETELGMLSVLTHKAQFGSDGTYFDYQSDAGQENLYFITRWGLDLEMDQRHHVVLLYQPLEIVTENPLSRNLRIDDAVFEEGTAVRFTYGFPYYRASYVYDVLDDPDHRFGLGASLQLRNANLLFESLNGDSFRANRDIGPVPLLKAVWEVAPSDNWWFGTEVDGIYAPISYLNGSDNNVEGVFLDWSVRLGVPLSNYADAFINLRYLAGGAEGTSEDEAGPGDGYVKNWLKFGALTVGFRFQPIEAASSTERAPRR